MATEKRPPSGSPGGRRRRPVPTIDLKATEVAAEPVAASEPQAPAAASSEPPGATAAADAVGPAPSPEPAQDAPKSAASGPQQSEPPDSPPPRQGIAWLPPGFPWPSVAAGAAGGGAVLLAGLLIWLMLPRAADPVTSIAPRLAAIETQLREFAARPAPAGIDPRTIEALTVRLAKLETALSTPRPSTPDPALAGRIGAIENAIKPLNGSVAALTRRADEAEATFRNIRGNADKIAAAQAELQSAARTTSADHGELEKLSAKIAALEASDRAMAERLAKSTVSSGSDRPVRLVVSVSALRAALDRGEPYSAELAVVQTLSKDTDAFSALGPFAATGLPSTVALGRELLVILPVIQRAAGTPPRDGGILDRLQANAERLVRIRPVDEVPGEDVSAILSRIEVRAAHADIAGVLTELAKLPPAVRAPAVDWITKAEGRAKALEASRRLAAAAAAALKPTP